MTNMNLKTVGLCGILICCTWVAEIKAQTTIPLIELKGTGYERGLQHGRLLKGQISELYATWKIHITKDTRRNADTVVAEFLSNSTYAASIKKHTPDLWQEIRGIAEGSGQPFADVLAFQLVDEYWAYLDSIAHIQKERCSAIGIAATKGRPAIVSQNIDLETFRQGYQVETGSFEC